MHVVITNEDIHYTYIYKFNIPITVIKRRWIKKDPTLFYRFFKVANHFNPDLIHTWGVMSTFYATPAAIILKCPIIANLIANSKRSSHCWSITRIFFKIDCIFARHIVSNSKAGLLAYDLKDNNKSTVIYNGVRLGRFCRHVLNGNLRNELKIKTKYLVTMVASFSENKDFDFFVNVAKKISIFRDDVTLIGVGGGGSFRRIKNRIQNEKIFNVILTGKRDDVEDVIAISDIGVLFTNNNNHAEGISNSILEYMALEKPVITTDFYGGSKEIIDEGLSGYIVKPDIDIVVEKINILLNNEQLRKSMGKNGRKIVESRFSVQRMAEDYLQIYEGI